MARFLYSTSVSHNAQRKFHSLGLITLRELSVTGFLETFWGTSSHIPLRDCNVWVVFSWPLRSDGQGAIPWGGASSPGRIARAPDSTQSSACSVSDSFPCRLCNAISTEDKRGFGDVYRFLKGGCLTWCNRWEIQSKTFQDEMWFMIRRKTTCVLSENTLTSIHPPGFLCEGSKTLHNSEGRGSNLVRESN